MSELRNVIGMGIADRECAFADDVKNLRTGKMFKAEIQEIEDTALNTELGIDARATTVFYIRDKTVEPVAMDKWSAIGKTFQVLPRNAPDNPATLQLKVFCMVLTGKDS